MCTECLRPSKGDAISDRSSQALNVEDTVSVLPLRDSRKERRLKSRLSDVFKKRSTRRIIVAVAFLTILGILPAIIWFCKIPQPFTPNRISCGSHDGPFDAPRNNTHVDGVANFFTIDRTTEGLSFGAAKFVDLIWDVLLARGVFFLTLWVSYVVFASSLLRALQSEDIPYDTFVALSLNGPTALSTYWVLKQCWRFKSHRMKLRFFAIGIGMLYAFSMPMLLTAISGYIVDTSSFARVPGTAQLLHTAEFASTSAIFYNKNNSRNYCLDETSEDWRNLLSRSKMHMACCTPMNCTRQYDGRTLSSNIEWGQVCPSSDYFSQDFPPKTDWQLTSWQGSECGFYGNESFVWTDTAGAIQESYCTQRLTTEIYNHTFSAWGPLSTPHVSTPFQKCYENHAYTYDSIADNVQCLPESNPKYRWGFSTRLTSTAILVHLVWSVTVFALWLEAETCGTLQKESGFKLSQLRSAYVLTKAAEATTERCGDWLIQNPDEANKMISDKEAGVKFEVLRKRRGGEGDLEKR